MVTVHNYMLIHLDQFEPIKPKSDLADWWFYVHNKMNHKSSFDWDKFNLQRNRFYTLTYKVRSFRLLPSPYATDCLDYPKSTEYLSRKDCIRKCKVRQSVENCGGLSRDMDVIEGDPDVRFVSTDSEDNCIHKLHLSEHCLKVCPRYDCFKQHMEALIVQKTTNAGSYLSWCLPFGPKITFEMKPSIGTVEFLCYLASTAGLWFGFSVIQISVKLKDLISEYVINHMNVNKMPKINYSNAVKHLKTWQNTPLELEDELDS